MLIYVINGANLNLLGTREPEIYGKTTLKDIENGINERALKNGHEVRFFQSNHEGALIDKIHEAGISNADGVILNAGAFTHYSYAIRDAVSSVSVPVVEVHISNIYARDEFRHKSVLSEVCKGVLCGFGVRGYYMALDFLTDRLM